MIPVGTPITALVYVGLELIPDHGHVTADGTTGYRPGRFYWQNDDEFMTSSSTAHEGITWIRGHFARGSAEVEALEVANALSVSRRW